LELTNPDSDSKIGRDDRNEAETAMIRKFLWLLLALAVISAASTLGSRRGRSASPFLKRLNRTITLVVWVLLVFYGIAFLYWLYTQVIR